MGDLAWGSDFFRRSPYVEYGSVKKSPPPHAISSHLERIICLTLRCCAEQKTRDRNVGRFLLCVGNGEV